MPARKRHVVGHWKPEDGSKFVKVKCGRRHTVLLDDLGRIWTMGENKKYGQLGQDRKSCTYSKVPELMNIISVGGINGLDNNTNNDSNRDAVIVAVDIDCGWSHTVALVKTISIDGHDDVGGDKNNNQVVNYQLYGWGRSDKSQFGIQDANHINQPRLIDQKNVQKVACGSESTMIMNDKAEVFGCGWNEHGNLANGNNADEVKQFAQVQGAKIRNYHVDAGISSNKNVLLAAGGAHVLVSLT